MSVEHYREAMALLEAQGRGLRVRFPAEDASIEKVEAGLAVTLPDDYKQMLRDVGILMARGFEVDGIGRNGLDPSAPDNILGSVVKERAQGRISDTMVAIMSSGYGPVFVLDCADTARTGEAPVLLVPLEGHRSPDVERVADSFGAFLLGEVRAAVGRGAA